MKFITHSKTFHADDVFASAILAVNYGKSNFFRNFERRLKITSHELNDPSVIIYDIGRVYDVGKSNYDHHQIDCPRYYRDYKHCAASLLWDKFAFSLITKAGVIDNQQNNLIKKIMFTKLFKPIALIDNGQLKGDHRDLCTLSAVVGAFNRAWKDPQEITDKKFIKVVLIAINIFKEMLKNTIDNLDAESKVFESKAIGNILIFDQYYPWRSHLYKRGDSDDLLFVIYPSERVGYNVQTIPIDKYTFTNRKDLPSSWLSNPPVGCHFVHNELFLAAFDTFDNALAATKTII